MTRRIFASLMALWTVLVIASYVMISGADTVRDGQTFVALLATILAGVVPLAVLMPLTRWVARQWQKA